MKKSSSGLTLEQEEAFMTILKMRFEKNMRRHEGLDWKMFEKRLKAKPYKLWSLHEMERTGGEPDVIGYDDESNEVIVYDCSAESPFGRRSICYDREALVARKKNKPKNSAINMAREMGIEILSEKQYRELQQIGNFDTKTSSWIFTPTHIRHLGGALFCDRRYDTVFVYHNGAETYYAARGFRGCLKI